MTFGTQSRLRKEALAKMEEVMATEHELLSLGGQAAAAGRGAHRADALGAASGEARGGAATRGGPFPALPPARLPRAGL